MFCCGLKTDKENDNKNKSKENESQENESQENESQENEIKKFRNERRKKNIMEIEPIIRHIKLNNIEWTYNNKDTIINYLISLNNN